MAGIRPLVAAAPGEAGACRVKHGEIVDVRVDGSDHVEDLSFDIENVAHDFDTAKLNGADVPDSRVSPEGGNVTLRAE
ncbi:hypothetical protein BRC88_04990 [Halobacteriales archaeon QS_4_69_225]|nr:MAG: hypothetical protein BRC88_04990 [Halobacteriales archaeon QS_4_69_225]